MLKIVMEIFNFMSMRGNDGSLKIDNKGKLGVIWGILRKFSF